MSGVRVPPGPLFVFLGKPLFFATMYLLFSGFLLLVPVDRAIWEALVHLSVLQFFIAVDVTVVNVALPSIGDDLGVDPRGLTWVVAGYTTSNPLIPLAFFGNRTRVRANLAIALLSAALSTSFLLLTFYLQD